MTYAPNHILAGGAPEGFDASLIIKELHKSNAPVLHIVRDDKRLSAMAAALAFFDPSIPVLHFPGWERM